MTLMVIPDTMPGTHGATVIRIHHGVPHIMDQVGALVTATQGFTVVGIQTITTAAQV